MIKRKQRWGVRNEVDNENKNKELTDEELQELVLQAQQEALQEEKIKEQKPRRPFPKWIYWIIAISMVLNALAFLPEKFSLPAVKFLITSTKLSKQADVQTYKKAVVVIAADDSRGTGFSISPDGTIITNYHVIENSSDRVTIAFPDEGPFSAEVVHTYPTIDLAILKTNENKKPLPHLTLANEWALESNDHVTFIGNPLRFQGIVNEGTILDKIKLRSWDEEVIMIKAPVYRGNSGSPVLNEDGQVIGVIFATLKHDKHGKVGLFVPIDVYHQYQNDHLNLNETRLEHLRSHIFVHFSP